jgi:hypothetical protein
VGGLTILIDVFGTDRLRRMEAQSADRLPEGASRIQRTYLMGVTVVIIIVVAVVAVTNPYNPQDEFPGEASTNPAVVFALIISITLAIGIYKAMTRVLTWIFENGKLALAWRLIGIVLVTVGFLLDLLAS